VRAEGKLRIACRRHDWSNALFDGRLDEPGMTFLPEAHLDIHALTSANPEVDFMECGLINYYQARSEGVPIMALPVFLRAAFRHSYIFVNTNAGIDAPRDLEGRRVGTRYGMTANVWARALLQHQYGVQLEKIRWLNQETRPVAPYELPAGTVLEPVGTDVDLQDWLVQGKIDALVHANVVAPRLLARGNVRPLFANAPEEERAYYRATKIVPVMNVIAYRQHDPLAGPETIARVFDIFRTAKAIDLVAMEDPRDSGLVWYAEALAAQVALLGPDPAPYSVEAMRTTLDAFISYGLEQGVLTKRLELSDLFWEPAS